MHIVAALFVSVALLLSAAPLYAEEGAAPAPKLNRVDYRSPNTQKALGEKLGFGTRSQSILRQLQKPDATPGQTLEMIVRWVDRNLKPNATLAGSWRTVDQIVKDGSLGGLADRALVIGAFARAAGIPAVWVKTLPTSWLIAVKEGRSSLEEAGGHIFLEVYVDGRWQLLDPASARLYESYDPRAKRLPDQQFAYDKGGDPYALILPNRPALWAAQLKAYVAGVQLGSLPWALSRDLLSRWRVYVAGKGGPASYASATAKAFGFNVEKSINSGWERALAQVRGKTLIVVTYGGRPALPMKYWKTYLPDGYEQILSGQKKLPKGWISHRLRDGTRVILVTATEYGPVELAVSEALEG